MAKVKINKLPPGFKLVDGKIVQEEQPNMQMGGYVTGDQMNYSLVTVPSDVTNQQMSDSNDPDIRYSLSSVPREEANIEAEGGETALTDLNQDGNFGLYDIKGPRHSSGGVPMFLPDQSFIFSDTKDMKFNKSEMAEFGIESRKKKTPAQISKQYQLNKFYGAIDDEYADDIQVASAELMLDKNKKDLSKLAFAQELKKDFEDGVPLAAHPYLISIGEDPIEFTAKVEEISKQKAMMKALAALPPEEQMKVLALQEMLAQAQQQPQQPMGEMQQPMQQPMGQPMQQGMPPMMDPMADPMMDPMMDAAEIPDIQPQAKYGLEMYQKKGEKKDGKMYSITDPKIAEQYKPYGINVDQSGIGAAEYARIQRKGDSGLFGGAKSNLEGFKAWEGIYPGYAGLMQEINAGKGDSPEVGKFQAWVNNQYIPQQVQAIAKARKEAGYDFTDEDASTLEGLLINDYGFSDAVPGRGMDSDFGTVTSSMRPLSFTVPKKKVEEVVEERDDLIVPEVGQAKPLPTPEFWKQDLLKMNAIAGRKRRLGLPFQPAVTPVDIDYTLEDPTRAIAAINEQANIANQANMAFSGPQAGSARNASMAGKALKAVADTTAGVQSRNVQTANRGDYQQAAMDYKTEALQRAAKVKEYDDTEKALQAYMDEKNFDREQYAQAYSDALTNRGNTYNMNLTQDYFNIDPSTGGMIGQIGSRAFDPVKQQTSTEDQYMAYIAGLQKRGIEDDKALISGANQMLGLKGYNDPYQTNIQREYNLAQSNPLTQYGYPNQKRGGEKKLKKYAVPFYTGKMGM
jgi:hypothetical protein